MAAEAPAQNQRFTNEVNNVSFLSDVRGSGVDPALLEFEDKGGLFDLLASIGASLAVTREYEHVFLMLGTDAANRPVQAAMPIPHPSGVSYNAETRKLTVSSTRSPNIIISMSPYEATALGDSILPVDFEFSIGDGATLFLPRQSRFLPGSLYIHDLVESGGELYATLTGHNMLGRLSADRGWEPVWWPSVIDPIGDDKFRTNFLQLNSVAVGNTIGQSYYTAFSDLVTGPKPWKDGYGPQGKGVVFSAETRGVIARGLTCPHSAKLSRGELWLCNSGFGEVGQVVDFAANDAEVTRFETLTSVPGFSRGLAIHGDVLFVGTSRVIDSYERYAPGLRPSETRCGIFAIDRRDGTLLASLTWPNGYQIYDVQLVPGVKTPLLPTINRESDGINPHLRFLS